MTKTLEELKKEIELIQSQSNDKIQELINQYEVEKEKREEFEIVKRVNAGEYYYCIYNVFNDKNESTISYYCDDHGIIDTKYYNSNNYFHTREEAEKYLKRFLLELKILRTRDKVNGDWKPNWKCNKTKKYTIGINYNIIYENINTNYGLLLSFETEEKRAQFRELIFDEEIIEFLSF